MRRHTISDLTVVPESLFACYYCRHPVFRLSKKIYYACYGNREACLPNTYVLFVYEFDGPEKLYARGYVNAPSMFSPVAGASSSSSSSLPVRQRRSPASMQLESLYKSRNSGGGPGSGVGGLKMAGSEEASLYPVEETDMGQDSKGGNSKSSKSLLDFLTDANGRDGGLRFADYLNNGNLNEEDDEMGGSGWDGGGEESPSIFDVLKTLAAEGNDGGLGDEPPTSRSSSSFTGFGKDSGRSMASPSNFNQQGQGQGQSPYRHSNNYFNNNQHYRRNLQQQAQQQPRQQFLHHKRKPLPPQTAFSSATKRRLTAGTGPGSMSTMTTSGAVSLTTHKISPVEAQQPRPSLPSNYSNLHIPPAALANFIHNGLCVADELTKMHDKFDEVLSSQPSFHSEGPKLSPTMLENMKMGNCGGCLLLDSAPLEIECSGLRLYFTCLWFRNHTFLNEQDAPSVQPVAVLIKSAKSASMRDDYMSILLELESRIADNADSSIVAAAARICRALLCPESVELDGSSKLAKSLLRYPCTTLSCLDDFKETVRGKLWAAMSDREASSKEKEEQLVREILEEDIFGEVDGEDSTKSTGLLNSLHFADFVRRLGQVERRWPAGFRTWFREKSGWIFERLSLASRLKSGYGLRERASLSLSAGSRDGLLLHLSPLSKMSPVELIPERITSLLDEFCHDALIRSAQALFQSGKSKFLHLNPSIHHLKLPRSDWLELSQEGKFSRLGALGLGAMPVDELSLIGLDTAAVALMNSPLLAGKSRGDKLGLLTRATKMEVINLTQSDDPKSAVQFVTVDRENMLSHFVCYLDDSQLHCQCQHPPSILQNSTKTKLCEHLCAIALSNPDFSGLVSSWREEGSSRKSQASPSSSIPGSRAGKGTFDEMGEEVINEQDDEIECAGIRPAKLRPSQVEIIHCQGSLPGRMRAKKSEAANFQTTISKSEFMGDDLDDGDGTPDASTTEYLLSLLKQESHQPSLS